MKQSLPPSSPEWKLCILMCSIGRLCLYCKAVIFKRPTSAGGNARENESSHPTGTVEAGGVGNLSQEWQDHPESSESRPMQSPCRGAETRQELSRTQERRLANRAAWGDLAEL